MELPTLMVNQDEAKKQVELYRRARRTITLTREDERMLAAYRAIARGREVIDLHRAIELGGYEEHQGASSPVDLPRLAVFRSDQRWVWCDGIGRDGTLTLRSKARPRTEQTTMRIQMVEVFSADDTRKTIWSWGLGGTWRAMIPPVPPYLRPTRRFHGEIMPMALSGFVTLFEAEWQRDKTVPPKDPALLKRLGGTLYEVVAKWDLTPVEQAVLAGRRPTPEEIAPR